MRTHQWTFLTVSRIYSSAEPTKNDMRNLTLALSFLCALTAPCASSQILLNTGPVDTRSTVRAEATVAGNGKRLQLVNVVRGDLSLVGPRAVTRDELARYGDSVEALLGVRPGITGYWQVNGRSRLSYEDRVRLDLAYVSGWSLGLDVNILVKTARTLVRGEY